MKTFDLTPGDSRDYAGVRVKCVSVGQTRKGGGSPQPVVTVEVEEVAGGGTSTKSTGKSSGRASGGSSGESP